MEVQGKAMKVEQVLHMNGGCDDSSYLMNSQIQKKIITISQHTTEAAILDFCCTNLPKSLGIADLGCSSGPNALLVVSEIIDAVEARCRLLGGSPPEFRVFLNDLPGNDFNTIFKSLAAFYEKLKEKGSDCSCFIFGVPGTFYGRLFPDRSLEFVHSSSSLHWLSQVPPELDEATDTPLNKGSIYVSKKSPRCVLNAYLLQFQTDFSLFLRCRSEEIVSGGRMVLSFMGRTSADPTSEECCRQWDLLAQALNEMVNEGLVEEERVDSFNAPYYAPSPEEIMGEIEKEGSFVLDCLQSFEVDWDTRTADDMINEGESATKLTSGEQMAKTIRAVVESMLKSRFVEEIMDDLFLRYGKILDDYLSTKRGNYINLVVSLIRR